MSNSSNVKEIFIPLVIAAVVCIATIKLVHANSHVLRPMSGAAAVDIHNAEPRTSIREVH